MVNVYWQYITWHPSTGLSHKFKNDLAMNPRNISTNSLTVTRDEESLFFVGLTPTPGLENLGLYNI